MAFSAPLHVSQPFLVILEHLLNAAKNRGSAGFKTPQSVGDLPQCSNATATQADDCYDDLWSHDQLVAVSVC